MNNLFDIFDFLKSNKIKIIILNSFQDYAEVVLQKNATFVSGEFYLDHQIHVFIFDNGKSKTRIVSKQSMLELI